jgi:tetratricopeptide (TPR) repeat protein
MTSALQHFLAAALRLMIVASCCWGIWYSWRVARADYLFRQDTETSLHQAISTTPDAWAYYMRLAEFEPAHAQQLLTAAEHLNPYNAQADIELGLQYEAQGEFGKAEQCFLRAFAVDRTYLPRWSLASFYFRRGNIAAFWTWARSAAEMPSESTAALFDLCWRVSPDADEITRRILNNNPNLLRQYLDFLLSKSQTYSAAGIAIRLIQYGDPNTDVPRMFSAINQLITDDKNGNSAKEIWTALVANHWVVADRELPNNPNFARDPLPVQFDWTLPSNSGIQSVPGPSGLEAEFSGLEPDQCDIAEQAVVLDPGDYELNFSYHTQEIAPGTGLRWQIVGGDSIKPLAESSDLSSEALTRAKMTFSIPRRTPLAHLRLIYQRALGTPPISGSLVIPSVQIHKLP